MAIAEAPAIPEEVISAECWECGGCIAASQLAESREELNADICETCAPWVRGVFSTEQS
jgi:hypothetical protein